MTTKTLNDRVIEAKALANLSRITSRDKHGRVNTVLVPGSEATRNQVIIRRYNGAIVSCECRKEAGGIGYAPCQGNIHGVCRHSIAAIMVAMKDQGYTPRFRKDAVEANKFATKHLDEVLTNPDSGLPVVFTLKSNSHAKNMLYFIGLDSAIIELKADAAKAKKLVYGFRGNWQGVAPEEISVEVGKHEIERELAEFTLRTAGFDGTDDDGHPGHPNNYGDFNGVR